MLNIIIRTVVIFFVLLLLMRLLGKRQLGELELNELVVSILIADLASVPLQSPDLSIWYGLVPCAALFACEYLLAWATMKSVGLRRVVCGTPCFLVIRGEICQKEMRRCRFTVVNTPFIIVLTALRRQQKIARKLLFHNIIGILF